MSSHSLHYSAELRTALQHPKADPQVRQRSIAGAAPLPQANTVRITSPAGTSLSMQKGSRPSLANYGTTDEPGWVEWCRLPNWKEAEYTTPTDL